MKISLHKCVWCLRTPAERVTILPALRSDFIHKDVLTGDSLVIPLCEYCIKMNKILQGAYDVLADLMNAVEDMPEPTSWIDKLERWMSTL